MNKGDEVSITPAGEATTCKEDENILIGTAVYFRTNSDGIEIVGVFQGKEEAYQGTWYEYPLEEICIDDDEEDYIS